MILLGWVFLIAVGGSFTYGLILVLALFWWIKGPKPTPANLSRLSQGWKMNLQVHAGYGAAIAGLFAMARAGGMLGGIRHTFADLATSIAYGVVGVLLVGYSLWFWLRIFPRIRPVWDVSSAPLPVMNMAAVAGAVAAVGSKLSSMDDVQLPSSASGSMAGPASVKNLHTGSGQKIEVRPDGTVYASGKFVGHRDASGRVLDGSGKISGTLKDDGSMYAPNGDYVGRLFK